MLENNKRPFAMQNPHFRLGGGNAAETAIQP
jgi:hypothetical protein